MDETFIIFTCEYAGYFVMLRFLIGSLFFGQSASENFFQGSDKFFIKDVVVDETCEMSAKIGDHLLFEYVFSYANGTEVENIVSSARKPNQLFHLILVHATVP